MTIAAAIRCSSCSIPVVVNWYLMLFAKRYSQYSINHLCYYSSSIVVIIRVAIEVVKVVIAVVIVLVTLILWHYLYFLIPIVVFMLITVLAIQSAPIAWFLQSPYRSIFLAKAVVMALEKDLLVFSAK